MKEEAIIFDYLIEIGCCKPCCLRYICSRSSDLEDLENYIVKEGFLNETTESLQKKLKANFCVVCLGLLQCFDSILNHPDLKKVVEYDSKTFTCSISMPASIMVRERSLRLALEDKFPKYFTEEKVDIPLNKAWKIMVKDKLVKHINKKFENSDICDFSINISMDYDENTTELSVLKDLQPKMFEDRKIQHRKFNGELYSRTAVQTALEKTPSSLFKLHVKVPPEIPACGLKCVGVECKHNSIYFAGRYCKYSRELSQTPWIVDGIKTMDTSVQEIIFKGLFDTFDWIKEQNVKFSSSGREDCDVRCLGKGRPFYLEISDPKITEFTSEHFRTLQNKLNASDFIKVRDLQLVHRLEICQIKEGEETKSKEYNALCITKTPVTQQHLDKLNSLGEITIRQKTPIRVLHRRPLAIRERKIHKITAKAVPNRENMFELNMTTQAGTYVKEFVHGDFGRTKPNVGEIIGLEVDILALDVISINLDWPKEVCYD